MFFNKSQDELIRSLFFNRVNEPIIIVSATKKDDYNSLKCRTVSLELIREALDTQAEQDFVYQKEVAAGKLS